MNAIGYGKKTKKRRVWQKKLEISYKVGPPTPPHGEVTFENLKFEKVEKFVRAYNVCCLRYALYMTSNALDCRLRELSLLGCMTRCKVDAYRLDPK